MMDNNQKPKQPNLGRWVILFGSFFIFIALIVFRVASNDGDRFASTFMLVIFGGVGLIFVIFGVRQWYTRFRVGKPEVQISKTTAVLGDTLSVNFHNTFKREVQVETFSAKLIFKESATYQQGTNTRTVHHEEIIEEINTVGQNFKAGSFLSESFEFTIPRHGMHTLNVRRNKLTWLIQFEMDIPRMLNFKEDYVITVLPEISSKEWD